MFCSKCGKQIERGNKFCPYCGAVQVEKWQEEQPGLYRGGMEYRNAPIDRTTDRMNRGILGDMTGLDVVICAIFGILILWWTFTFFPGLKQSWISFSSMSADAKFLGILLLAIPYIFVLAMAGIGIYGVMHRAYHISMAILIGILGLFMKIADIFILTSFTYADYKLILRTLFVTYGEIGLSTVVLSIGAGILLYSKSERKI